MFPCLIPTCISYDSSVEDSIVGKHTVVSHIMHVTIWQGIVKSIIKRVSADTEKVKSESTGHYYYEKCHKSSMHAYDNW